MENLKLKNKWFKKNKKLCEKNICFVSIWGLFVWMIEEPMIKLDWNKLWLLKNPLHYDNLYLMIELVYCSFGIFGTIWAHNLE